MIVPAFSQLEEAKLAQVVERGAMARLAPEAAGFSVRGTSIAARLTKIARMLKRSVGF
jgi:hypothetical protein